MAKKKAKGLGELERRKWVDARDRTLSITKQCELVSLPRSTHYYRAEEETELNLELMKLIDSIYLEWPFYGSRKITEELERRGKLVNRKRVQRLMQLMGIEVIYPRPNVSKANEEHRKYPYLLKNVKIDEVNFVWSSDITYIPMENEFVYLTAVMDWYSRYVLTWRLSKRLESGFCVAALEEALKQGKPEIFNTDQGTQYTSKSFIQVLEKNEVRISMDGKGRAFDNIFIERLWRTVKYEEVYCKAYEDVKEAEKNLGEYFKFYNTRRLHQSLGYKTPEEVFYKRQIVRPKD